MLSPEELCRSSRSFKLAVIPLNAALVEQLLI